ncbi:MAG: hypothetical protein DRP01_04805 [Archaeoglobales archaeon]|nr:MAG: hypothetical protein DRP01_04805 [Archaeoglobales archaeon]
MKRKRKGIEKAGKAKITVGDLLAVWEPDRILTDRIKIYKEDDAVPILVWDKPEMRWNGDISAVLDKKVTEAWFGCESYTLYIKVEE